MIDLGSAKPKTDALLQRFDRLVDHPDGILQLRRLILSLAIQGRLVERNPSDRPAAVSFPRLALAAVEPDDDTYPAHWLRVPLRQMGEWRGGGTPSKSRPEFWQGKLPWVSPKDMKLLRISDAQDHISKAAVEDSAVRLIPEGSLLMVVRGMILARAFPVALTTREVTINQDMKALLPSEPDTTDFLLVALRAFEPVVLAAIERSTHGTCKLETETLHALATPVPPLAEQKRIVAKVDELMALCDRLEAQLHERDTRQAALARAALARFADAPTPANLELLFHGSFTITPVDLRKTILTLAVQGHLVPQDPDDEPADALLRRIDQRRTEMLKAGYPNRDEANTQIRKQSTQVLPDGLEPTAPGWSWATLIQASLLVADCHNKTAPYVDSGVRLLRTTNIRDGKLNLDQPKFVSPTTYERWSARCKPEPGDILITREAPMGEVCIIPEGMKVCLGQRMMMVRLVPGTMDSKFLLYSLMDPALMARVQDKPVGATVQHLRVGGVETLLTPIPPLAEQRRIVAKVDQLMALVDQWESQLATTRTISDNLLSALVSELTAPPA